MATALPPLAPSTARESPTLATHRRPPRTTPTIAVDPSVMLYRSARRIHSWLVLANPLVSAAASCAGGPPNSGVAAMSPGNPAATALLHRPPACPSNSPKKDVVAPPGGAAAPSRASMRITTRCSSSMYGRRPLTKETPATGPWGTPPPPLPLRPAREPALAGFSGVGSSRCGNKLPLPTGPAAVCRRSPEPGTPVLPGGPAALPPSAVASPGVP
mmetsp:Transcript_36141/g.63034  ORF Transcript_36141/g.63034 Transcript_36141/m.63034 type:complete len:215 (-) Transcript_36141:458-1102(-)